ncbi:amidohydrolase family protein [Nakamurella sp. YIM 132087]|uniref:Amidohydrolase family protein n=1 Tax=Nakamurella alba TaxID=2665158 RepID=A0A7K1FU05_9ACTN|nr:amidohydrolase family protein [Nakamurella alba]MTD16314.1 amidohydrolase family protein [Nakamurella alba]
MSTTSAVPGTVRVIDAWAQPWTPTVAAALPERTLNVLRRYRNSELEGGIPMAEMLERFDRSDVDLALMSGGPATPIGEVFAALEARPGKFLGVVWCDPTDGIMKAVRELEAYVRDYPVCGFKLEPFYLWRDPTDRIFYPLYAKCEELGITLQTQVGGTGPLFPSRSGQPLHIDDVALDFPDLRIVCGHVGSPWVEEMIHVAWKHENVYIDTSARLPKHFEPGFRKFLASYGQDKCLFATDWPLLDFDLPLRQVDDLALTLEVRAKFLHGNAIRAFDLQRFGVTGAGAA